MITICRWRSADKFLAEHKYDFLISAGWRGVKHCTLRAKHNYIVDVRDVTPLHSRGDHEALLVDAPNAVVGAIRFGREHAGDGPFDLLSHCHLGVSRSTALALVFLVARGISEHDAIHAVYSSRGDKCKPNWYFLTIADQLMGTNILGACRAQGRRLKSTRRDLKI